MRRRRRRLIRIVFSLVTLAMIGLSLLVVSGRWSNQQRLGRGRIGYEIVNSYPHDSSSFTQGLTWHDGHLYETTGRYGSSRLLKIVLETGKPVQQHSLSPRLFGEGMTVLGDRIVQLTYRSGIGIVYDLKSFLEMRRFRYEGEGWGLTHDEQRLIMSNGTAHLSFLDTDTYEPVGQITVRDRGRPVHYLNELEYVNGEIFANIWYQDRVARIDPQSGDVLGYIDLQTLRVRDGISRRTNVLNGIAYDAQADRLFVTGKNWPQLFEIHLVPIRK